MFPPDLWARIASLSSRRDATRLGSCASWLKGVCTPPPRADMCPTVDEVMLWVRSEVAEMARRRRCARQHKWIIDVVANGRDENDAELMAWAASAPPLRGPDDPWDDWEDWESSTAAVVPGIDSSPPTRYVMRRWHLPDRGMDEFTSRLRIDDKSLSVDVTREFEENGYMRMEITVMVLREYSFGKRWRFAAWEATPKFKDVPAVDEWLHERFDIDEDNWLHRRMYDRAQTLRDVLHRAYAV